MRAQSVDVFLLVAELHGFDHGDPDAGSDVSHEIEQAGGISHALIWNRAIGNGSERHEHKTQRGTLNHERPPEIHRSHVQAEPGKLPHGIGGGYKADPKQLSLIEFSDRSEEHTSE